MQGRQLDAGSQLPLTSSSLLATLNISLLVFRSLCLGESNSQSGKPCHEPYKLSANKILFFIWPLDNSDWKGPQYISKLLLKAAPPMRPGLVAQPPNPLDLESLWGWSLHNLSRQHVQCSTVLMVKVLPFIELQLLVTIFFISSCSPTIYHCSTSLPLFHDLPSFSSTPFFFFFPSPLLLYYLIKISLALASSSSTYLKLISLETSSSQHLSPIYSWLLPSCTWLSSNPSQHRNTFNMNSEHILAWNQK